MADLRRALRRHRAAELTIEPLIDAVAEFGGAVADAAGKSYRLDNPRAVAYLRNYMTERVNLINSTTREQIKAALKAEDPATAVREVFRQAREVRAELIAETEIVSGSNWAAVDAGKWTDILDRKRWSTRQDARVRPAHAAMHGQTVGWNDSFTAPNGAKAKYPGGFSDPALSARCRCAAVPVAPTVVEEFDRDPVELFDALRKPVERRMTKAWQRVFEEQEQLVLEELGL